MTVAGQPSAVTSVSPSSASRAGSQVELRALRRKYEEIVRLRQQGECPEGSDALREMRRGMAALAAEFPGALREADELSMGELLERVLALAEAEAGTAAVEPWMEAMARFHALTRGALCAKKWLRGRKQVDAEAAAAFLVAAHAFCYAAEASEWAEQLAQLATPPKGRLTEVVFDRMAIERGTSSDAVRRLVFLGLRRG